MDPIRSNRTRKANRQWKAAKGIVKDYVNQRVHELTIQQIRFILLSLANIHFYSGESNTENRLTCINN